MLEITKEQHEYLIGLRGLVATVVLSGTVEADYASAHEELRAYNIASGFTGIEYKRFHSVLVEAGRDEVAAHALHEGYGWVLQIDADATPFAPDSLVRLLYRAYCEVPSIDAIGAYCQLKQSPFFQLLTLEPEPGKSITREKDSSGLSELEDIFSSQKRWPTKNPISVAPDTYCPASH